MFIAILTLISALSISAVAIYYSVAGLAAIFAAAVVPIIIMGVVLEVGKLVTAVWLHRNWNNAVWWLKSYLIVALIVLMFITSMGIFGFLSKAHVEQTSMTLDQKASITSIESKIERSESKIDRWNTDLGRLLKGEDVRVDSLVMREQAELDKLFQKIKQEKDDARQDADKQIEIQKERIKQAKERKDSDIAVANERYKGAFSKRKLDDAINDAKANELAVASSAQKEILAIQELLNSKFKQIDEKYASQVTDIEKRISDLRNQANAKTEDIEGKIINLEKLIEAETLIVDQAREEKAVFEKEFRKLEAEVGPVKYIAEFIYAEKADQELLEEAVRWVIIVIIFVFDPLAVLLLIAANMSLVRRLPGPRPEDLVDLEKPDPEDLTPPSSPSPTLTDKHRKIEKEWNDKLSVFNQKVQKPKEKPLEIVVDDDKTTLKFQQEEKEKEFERRLKEDEKRLEEYSRKAKEEDDQVKKKDNEVKDGFNIDEVAYDVESAFVEPEKEDPTISEKIEKEMEKPIENEKQEDGERIKPDLTTVIEPETDVNKPKNAKPMVIRTMQKTIETTEPKKDKLESTPIQKKATVEKVEQSDVEKKALRDRINRDVFIMASGITEEDAKNHPPITKSRMQFFEDHIDGILKGDETIESIPPEIRKTIAIIMSEFPSPPIAEPEPAPVIGVDKGIEKMSVEQLAEKFQVTPELEDRDITDDELDTLLAGTEEEINPGQKTQIIIQNGKKIRVPVNDDLYVQNEEQSKDTQWGKIKELDLPEPEKNEIELPTPKPTEDENKIIDKTDETDQDLEELMPEHTISPGKIEAYKKRMLSDNEYQQKIEARIDNLITKIEDGELKITDLTETDRNVIINIMKDQKEDEV